MTDLCGKTGANAGSRPLAVGLLSIALLAGCADPLPPSQILTVEVTGFDYNWHIRYPGPDGQLGTGDDIWSLRNLHLPADAAVELRLLSRDFLYNFWLPEYSVYEIAVPDVPMVARFRTDSPGETELLGDQMCGFSHEDLIGRLVVQDTEAFQVWQETQESLSASAALQDSGAPEGGNRG